MSAPTVMPKAERLELGKLVRLRAKVAKADVDTRAARLLSDFEAQLAARYSSTHEAWAEITANAKRIVAEADAVVAERCRAMGIPAEFRPQLQVSWYGRGENGLNERRVELRRVAQSRMEAHVRAAKLAIDRSELALQTELSAGAITSTDGRAFLDAMPSVEALLPPLELALLEHRGTAP